MEKTVTINLIMCSVNVDDFVPVRQMQYCRWYARKDNVFLISNLWVARDVHGQRIKK
ncbi:MAG: hypothetical protein LBS16_06415 [Prevotellaceae bacterium]|nr:hypothetical protein [Prevotellaceae bacterium]